ncbi:probable exopolysaccharide biosynthesis protein, sugar transferase [Erwinia sp. Ejp617]|nr:glycosyltransferase family 2 protein [Erwinia sp. Ejp617]ADP10992.1 probable exopolysaccharide biosynthesis protein, sugar transferase [Erwinia sp. Ejp617]
MNQNVQNFDGEIELSIIIPAFNVMEYIIECIDSVLVQWTDSIEIIVVNDGSTDGTDVLLAKVYGSNEKVTIINQENKGLSSARNMGLSKARGRYIALLDGDDTLKSNSLKKIMSCLEKNSPDVLMVDHMMSWDDGGLYVKKYEGKLVKNNLLDVEENAVLSKVYDNSEVYIWKYIFRSDFYRKKEFPVGRNFEDVRIFPFLLKQCRTFFYLPVIFINYKQREASILKTKSVKNVLDLSSSPVDFLDEGGKDLLTKNEAISYTAFCMKVFVWSVQDLLISNGGYQHVKVLLENNKKSIICDKNEALKLLKLNDRKNYVLYRMLTSSVITLKAVFYLFNKNKFTKNVLRKIYNSI